MDVPSAPIYVKDTPTERNIQEEIDSTTITFTLPLLEKKYILTIGKKDTFIVLTAEDQLRIEPVYYRIKLDYNDFMSLGKTFLLCDDLKEVENSLKSYIEKALKGEKDYEIKLIKKSEKELELKMIVSLAEKKYPFSLCLEAAEKDKDKLIKDLRKIVDFFLNKYGDQSLLAELNKNVKIGKNINYNYMNNWRWKEGTLYDLDKNKLIATRNDEGKYKWCSVIGDKILPKNSISEWKIKIVNYDGGIHDLLIGVTPANINQFYDNINTSWTFGCCCSKLFLKNNTHSNYKSSETVKLKINDIIGVKMNTSKGELSFTVNGVDYGCATNKIPKDLDIVPIVMLFYKGNSIELLP